MSSYYYHSIVLDASSAKDGVRDMVRVWIE
jgi:hypothetical protein